MWIRLLLSCLQRKSNKPVWFIISSVDSAAESTGDMTIYWESPLTLLSMATITTATQLKGLGIYCRASCCGFIKTIPVLYFFYDFTFRSQNLEDFRGQRSLLFVLLFEYNISPVW